MGVPNESHDIIFAGGGATACVIAGRLAEMDPTLKILILEAGPHTRDVPAHVQPGRFYRNLLLQSEAFSMHIARSTEATNNRSLLVPSGRAVGGGSSVNFLVYTRAAASDYNDWEEIYGNKGWGSKDLIPLLKKAETYQSESVNDTHGDSGPIKVSFAQSGHNIAEDFLKTAHAFDTARSFIPDLNDFHNVNGYARWARYIDGKTGRRSDTAHHYIYNKLSNTNLQVLDRQRVVRVIFENNRAVGVEYISDAGRRDQSIKAELKTAFASKLVVVSAGAFGSPAILERSGIGSADILTKNGIKQHVDLPGVGQNYMDHNLASHTLLSSNEAETFDIISRGSEADIESHVKQWVELGTGPLASNFFEAGIKLRPLDDDFEETGPEFTEYWQTQFADKPDKPVIALQTIAAYGGMDPLADTVKQKYFSLGYWLAYPMASGSVHITDGMNPYGKLDVALGFLEHPADVGALRWAYKHSREIARRMRLFRGEYAPDHPTFSEGSPAECKIQDRPVAISDPKIAYTAEDNRAIDDFHRSRVLTTWHSSGTCAMKPREQGGVVDEKLDVYGIRSLKVADLSIIPSNVGANTYNTALAIGEKAALIIASEFGMSEL